jgi:N-acetyl-anhydromuramyl-L-alanine amidase AmpD
MRRIDLIIIHCSATKVTQDFSPEDLEACHKGRGFKTTGYHYYITKDGQLHQCRPEEMIGAHARRYNAHSIGICYEGGLDANGEPADTRTPAQKRTLVALLRSLKVDYPDARILGHCEFPRVHKRCPCYLPSKEYADLQPDARQ